MAGAETAPAIQNGGWPTGQNADTAALKAGGPPGPAAGDPNVDPLLF